mmetsp:Transcript_63113/g.159228  ORF Transcript_63113/g.159228 Transcript_63113/m.159228 type:complete len:208 (+) Transcript_63113:1078-1701(+)
MSARSICRRNCRSGAATSCPLGMASARWPWTQTPRIKAPLRGTMSCRTTRRTASPSFPAASGPLGEKWQRTLWSRSWRGTRPWPRSRGPPSRWRPRWSARGGQSSSLRDGTSPWPFSFRNSATSRTTWPSISFGTMAHVLERCWATRRKAASKARAPAFTSITRGCTRAPRPPPATRTWRRRYGMPLRTSMLSLQRTSSRGARGWPS